MAIITQSSSNPIVDDSYARLQGHTHAVERWLLWFSFIMELETRLSSQSELLRRIVAQRRSIGEVSWSY